MVSNTRQTNYEAPVNNATGAGGAGSSGAGNRTNNEPHEEEHLPPPPPLTPEVFLAQLLGSQRNTEQSEKNMEDILRNIAQNTQDPLSGWW
jgi:hypothetical protein